MRTRMRLSAESVLAIKELKRVLFGDTEAPVTVGYMIGRAYKIIEPKLDSFENEWLELSDIKVKDITGASEVLEGADTTVNLEKKVYEGISKLQIKFVSIFKGSKRVYRTFVVKLVLLAALQELLKK
ncbi:hypothetical protein JOC59_001777 [Weissella beninensis]|uniref:Uncharacterized protein n=1 Tax=Periweissella beninensis TaxID=504936 RepID=A0ABT0VIZ2_9LACO|nr:hypothetical protein [Periweissella beninensis]MBM7545035.1 hypothetical protein [Periweissella beninensis]MCM2436360.1 hypothetical protein [Periweissella beninensis]